MTGSIFCLLSGRTPSAETTQPTIELPPDGNDAYSLEVALAWTLCLNQDDGQVHNSDKDIELLGAGFLGTALKTGSSVWVGRKAGTGT